MADALGPPSFTPIRTCEDNELIRSVGTDCPSNQAHDTFEPDKALLLFISLQESGISDVWPAFGEG